MAAANSHRPCGFVAVLEALNSKMDIIIGLVFSESSLDERTPSMLTGRMDLAIDLRRSSSMLSMSILSNGMLVPGVTVNVPAVCPYCTCRAVCGGHVRFDAARTRTDHYRYSLNELRPLLSGIAARGRNATLGGQMLHCHAEHDQRPAIED